MQKININFETTIPERFFIERSLELLFGNTIDSYRMRLHNSYTILDELAEVIDKLRKNQLKHEHYALCVAEEAKRSLENDKVMQWRSLSKNYFIHHLLPTNEKKAYSKDKLYLACRTLLRYNKKYIDNIFSSITTEITQLNQIPNLTNPKDLTNLNRLTSDFWAGVRHLGYSKEYLHNFLRALASKHGFIFTDFFNIVESLLSREKEKYTVILAIKRPLQEKEFISDNFTILSAIEKRQLSESEFKKVRQYFEKVYGTLLKAEVEAFDYYSAAKLVKDKFFSELDILHIGQSDKKNKIDVQELKKFMNPLEFLS